MKGADGWWAVKGLNKLLTTPNYSDSWLNECFAWDRLSDAKLESHITKIATQNDIPALLDILSDECKTQLGSACAGWGACYGDNGWAQISFAAANRLVNTVKEFYSISKQAADKKAVNTYKTTKISMYSDGIAENSPFDLINDLWEINEIIFQQPIPYTGVNTYNVWDFLGNVFWGMNSKDAYENAVYPSYPFPEDSESDDDDSSPSWSQVPTHPVTEEPICVDGKNRSGLDESIFHDILVRNKPKTNQKQDGTNHTTTAAWSQSGRTYDPLSGISDIPSSYAKVNDNSIWPCTTYFCITVDFITNTYPLFTSGSDLSIESIVKRSNEHIRKFAGTSLIQSNMTINNFQIGLKDLNLPDIFHVWIVVTHKPVPMIDLVDEEREDHKEEDLKAKNLLENYYKNMGLEYQRQNDLSIFLWKEKEQKEILDSIERATIEAEILHNQRLRQEAMLADMNAYVDQMIDQKIIEDDADEFYNRFVEIAGFSRAIKDYTVTLNGIVKGMNNIPQSGPN